MSKKGIFWSVVGIVLVLVLIASGLVYFIPSWREAAVGFIKKDNNNKVEQPVKPNNELLEYQNQVKELNSKIEKLENDKSSLVSEIELKAKEYEESVNALNEQLTNKQNELVNAQNRLAELQNDNDANVAEIERLQTNIASLESNKQDLENQIEQINSEYEEQINNLNSDIITLNNRITTLNDEKKAINSLLTFYLNKIESYEKSIKSFKEQYSNLPNSSCEPTYLLDTFGKMQLSKISGSSYNEKCVNYITKNMTNALFTYVKVTIRLKDIHNINPSDGFYLFVDGFDKEGGSSMTAASLNVNASALTKTNIGSYRSYEKLINASDAIISTDTICFLLSTHSKFVNNLFFTDMYLKDGIDGERVEGFVTKIEHYFGDYSMSSCFGGFCK